MRQLRQSLSLDATNPNTFYTAAIKGVVNSIAFNFSSAYDAALAAGTRAFTVNENGGAARELVNRPTEGASFVHIPSLASQAADGTADGTRQVVGIGDVGLVITVSGTEVVADAIELVIDIID